MALSEHGVLGELEAVVDSSMFILVADLSIQTLQFRVVTMQFLIYDFHI